MLFRKTAKTEGAKTNWSATTRAAIVALGVGMLIFRCKKRSQPVTNGPNALRGSKIGYHLFAPNRGMEECDLVGKMERK